MLLFILFAASSIFAFFKFNKFDGFDQVPFLNRDGLDNSDMKVFLRQSALTEFRNVFQYISRRNPDMALRIAHYILSLNLGDIPISVIPCSEPVTLKIAKIYSFTNPYISTIQIIDDAIHIQFIISELHTYLSYTRTSMECLVKHVPLNSLIKGPMTWMYKNFGVDRSGSRDGMMGNDIKLNRLNFEMKLKFNSFNQINLTSGIIKQRLQIIPSDVKVGLNDFSDSSPLLKFVDHLIRARFHNEGLFGCFIGFAIDAVEKFVPVVSPDLLDFITGLILSESDKFISPDIKLYDSVRISRMNAYIKNNTIEYIVNAQYERPVDETCVLEMNDEYIKWFESPLPTVWNVDDMERNSKSYDPTQSITPPKTEKKSLYQRLLNLLSRKPVLASDDF